MVVRETSGDVTTNLSSDHSYDVMPLFQPVLVIRAAKESISGELDEENEPAAETTTAPSCLLPARRRCDRSQVEKMCL